MAHHSFLRAMPLRLLVGGRPSSFGPFTLLSGTDWPVLRLFRFVSNSAGVIRVPNRMSQLIKKGSAGRCDGQRDISAFSPLETHARNLSSGQLLDLCRDTI